MSRALALALLLAPSLSFAQSTEPSAPPQRGAGEESAASEAEPYADAPGGHTIYEPTRSVANSPDQRITLSGFLRTRGDLANNWDLGRGPTPSMRALWPTPYAGPSPGRTQTSLDMRLRLDVAIDVGWASHPVPRSPPRARQPALRINPRRRLLGRERSTSAAPTVRSTCGSSTVRCSCPSECSPRDAWAPSSTGARGSS